MAGLASSPSVIRIVVVHCLPTSARRPGRLAGLVPPRKLRKGVWEDDPSGPAAAIAQLDRSQLSPADHPADAIRTEPEQARDLGDGHASGGQ